MTTLIASFGSRTDGMFTTTFLFDTAARATVLLGIAVVALWVCRRASAAMRHRMWMSAVVGVLLIPVLSFAVPPLTIVLPGNGQTTTVSQASSLTSKWLFSETIKSGRLPADKPAERATPEPASVLGADNASQPGQSWDLGTTLIVLWMCGAFAIGLLSLISILSAAILVRKSPVLADSAWQKLLCSLQRQLDITRPVELRLCDRQISPMTWGLRRPVVLLPRHCETWTEECRRAVLLHELAHIQRWDWLSQMLAQSACIVYWFHPLVWLTGRQVRQESDRAADDAVLAAGMPATAYAEQLLAIAQQITAEWLHPAPAMARRGQLSRRIGVLLDTRRNRRIFNRRTSVLVTAGAFCAVLFAAVATVTVAEDETADKGTPATSPRGSDADQRMEAELRIETALERKIDVNFEDTPFQEVVEFFGRELGVNVWIDEEGINRQGLSLDTPMTLQQKGIRAESALKQLLQPWQVVAVPNGEVLQFKRESLTERERIEQALSEKTDVDFVDVPLSEAMAFFAKLHNLNVVIDEAALNDEGISPDTAVIAKMRGVTTRFALRTILEPLQLEAVINDDVLLITTMRAAEEILETRAYNFAEILGLPAAAIDRDSLTKAITTFVAPDTWEDVGGPGVISSFRPKAKSKQAPDTNDGPSTSMLPGILLIRQTWRVHQDIAAFLAAIKHQCHPKADKNEKPTLAEKNRQAIEKALNQRVSLSYQDVPLQDVMSELGKKHEINVVVDEVALNDEGISPDTPISLTAKDIPLQNGLRLAFKPIELTAVIDGEALKITTKRVAEEIQIVRILDVSDFSVNGDMSGLIDAIRSTVVPDSWDSVGAPGVIGSLFVEPPTENGVRALRLLVIRQTEQGHEQVAALLDQLRRVKR